MLKLFKCISFYVKSFISIDNLNILVTYAYFKKLDYFSTECKFVPLFVKGIFYFCRYLTDSQPND